MVNSILPRPIKIILAVAVAFLLIGFCLHEVLMYNLHTTTPNDGGIDLPASARDMHCIQFPSLGGDNEFYVSAKVTPQEFSEIIKKLGMRRLVEQDYEDMRHAFNVSPVLDINDWWIVTNAPDEEAYYGERLGFPRDSDTSMMYLKYKDGVVYFHNAVR